MLDDTIVAVATPPGRGGIGVIRLSGPDALGVGRTVVRLPSGVGTLDANRATVADLVLPEDGDASLDRVVVTYFRAPRSYTGEDVVEISCHGSPVVLEAALRALLRSGARAATPGEFTLRAFLTGRIDLIQAEAVRDLIDAQTTHQAQRAQRQLRGELSQRLAPLKERLLDVIVQLESTVEFVEDDISPDNRSTLSAELDATARSLGALSASYDTGRLVAEGVTIALVGPPNAGKSSVFNVLLESERAIVTDIPGTTRDLIAERFVLDGIPFRLVDTAGLRRTEDTVERIGVERTRSAIADADVVLLLLDGEATESSAARSLLEETSGLRRVVAINKVDVAPEPACASAVLDATDDPPLLISARTGAGIDALRAALVLASGANMELERSDILVTNARHHALLRAAVEHLDLARSALDENLSEEFALVGLHATLADLGELTGETAVDDILHRIFSTFCIGK